MIKRICKYALSAFLLILSTGIVFAQDKEDSPESLNRQTDAKDVIRSVFGKKSTADFGKNNRFYFSILPSAGFNPSVGLSIGVTSTGGKYYGNPDNTTFSVYNANSYISTYSLASFELKQNIFTAGNKFNIQGDVQAGKTVALDYGVGTGRKVQGDGSFSINNFPLANNADVFPIEYTYIKLNERIYRKILNHVYVGAGLVFDIYNNIDDVRRVGSNISTHNYRYNILNNFPTDNYSANGFLLNFQYNSRDQTNRPYKGLYADFVLRLNQQWLGSAHASIQLKTEVRKYWSLSKKNPEHVIAFWMWGSYLLRGSIPYLELPGTGSDPAGRLGRGYTIGRFKGPSFYYNEGEYRFPITANKLLGGVVFVNAESAKNQHNIKLFEYMEPGAGVGLRLLFNKHTRSNLCIDYGRGNYGSNGLFLGLNEVF
ncbi:MAG: hypothetical protein JWR67_2567 [Mucilaginibacter sp.]|nr:hypothetical protein [Mucilaginibacter sp.]